MSKKLISALAAVTLGASALSAPVMADVTATAGFVSDYYFRGFNLGDGGANGSIDYSNDSGIYAGIWAIDDNTNAIDLSDPANPAQVTGNDGLEYDIYFGWGTSVEGVDLGIGYTRYEYTYDTNFEHEINLSAGVAGFGLNIDLGEADPNVDGSEATDYSHIALSYAINDVWGVLVGNVDPDTDADDDDSNYIEVSAGGEVAGLDAGLSLGTVSLEGSNTSGYMVLSVSKTFDSLGF